MLEVLYIISAVAGIFAAIALGKENIKIWTISTVIAILTAIAFCAPTLDQIINNYSVPDFGTVFAALALIFWQFAFLTGNWYNVVNYEFSLVLLVIITCVIWPSIFITTPRQRCSEKHVTTEVVSLITTFDSGESIYEDGCIVCQINSSTYNYYYQQEDGTPIEGTIPLSHTTIVNIGADTSPYLQIVTERECSGYYPDIRKHCLGVAYVTYKLYIPEGSILNVYTND